MTKRNIQILMQDYKSLSVAVMIYATLVNTQTHTETDSFWLCCTCLTSAPSTVTRVAIFLILYSVLAVIIDFMPP